MKKYLSSSGQVLWSSQERGENMHILICGQGNMRDGGENGARGEPGKKMGGRG